MDNTQRAMRGWLTDTPPPPPRIYAPREEHKWYKMMGATDLLPQQEREAIRRSAAKHIAEIEAEQERKNAQLPDLTGQPTLQVAERYTTGRPRGV
jgi:hypothetical protein